MVCSLTLRCDAHLGAWLRGGMHTVELFEKFWSLDSTVWCTPMHTTELDSAVGCTPRSQTCSNMLFFQKADIFLVFVYLTSFDSILSKIFWSKKDSWLTVLFHINIFRHHREIASVKFPRKTDSWKVIDSAVWCILRSQTLWYDAHRRA